MRSSSHQILVGTNKGLVVVDKTVDGWKITKDYFRGFPVSMASVDCRTDTWWAFLAHRHWGQKLYRSPDRGESWESIKAPIYPKGAEIKKGINANLKNIWAFAEAGKDKEGELYLGTEPGGLFYSKNGGDTFELMEGLWNHPSRMNEWFGAGRDHPYIHSIVVDPRDSDHVYIAISCAGVFETMDGGLTWEARNEGLKADFLPLRDSKIGHDPHLILACQSQPDVIWQQNHCGIFRSTNGAKTWEDVTDPNGLARYGFALAIDDLNPDRAWVIPAVSDEVRIAQDGALCVCRTEDGGKSWQALRKGLPQEHCYDLVFRHGLARKNQVLVFGTTTGNLYLSEDDGDSWQTISNHLPRINSVNFV